MLDWENLKTFLVIARHRSLSAAARALNVNQTTMGRRLAGLEGRAGAKLLQSTPDGFVPTKVGERILANVERMETEALAAERAIRGNDQRLEGIVTVAAVEMFAARLVTQATLLLHETLPNITIKLITDKRSLNLMRREADLAIRAEPFEHHSVVVKRLTKIAFDLYASEDYLARFGLPDWSRQAEGHRIIALQDCLVEAQWLKTTAGAAVIAVVADSRGVQINACSTGLGMASLPCYLADEVPSLVRLEVPMRPPARALWLGVHKDLRQAPRIRAVIDALIRELKRNASMRRAMQRRSMPPSPRAASDPTPFSIES